MSKCFMFFVMFGCLVSLFAQSNDITNKLGRNGKFNVLSHTNDTLASIDSTGLLKANKFSGNGNGLTNLPYGFFNGLQTFGNGGETSYWTVPENVTKIIVVIYGAGGAGKAGYDLQAITFKGGTGGACLKKLNVTPGEVLTINIGARGDYSYWGLTGGGTSSVCNSNGDTLANATGGGPSIETSWGNTSSYSMGTPGFSTVYDYAVAGCTNLWFPAPIDHVIGGGRYEYETSVWQFFGGDGYCVIVW